MAKPSPGPNHPDHEKDPLDEPWTVEDYDCLMIAACYHKRDRATEGAEHDFGVVVERPGSPPLRLTWRVTADNLPHTLKRAEKLLPSRRGQVFQKRFEELTLSKTPGPNPLIEELLLRALFGRDDVKALLVHAAYHWARDMPGIDYGFT